MNSGKQRPAQLDAFELTRSVRRRIVDFSIDDRLCRDEQVTEIARRIWLGPPAQGGLVSELWVEGAFPAETCDASLRSLVAEGRFDAELCRVLDESGGVPADRSLYKHQRDAIRLARPEATTGCGTGERPALVVTAGTGAGKTECFLLPALNDLYGHARVGNGVRCLILYPMNALVNDQVDRLYGWLRNQSRVTLFHFTSETPEDKRNADHDRIPNWSPCRLRTRQEARGLETREGARADSGQAPDILITNYSMLEYMLSRPQDAMFFGSALQAVILDEAHLYTGTLAAEIAILLRRLLVRCGVSAEQVLQIATSATLGTGSGDELRDFTATLFSKAADAVHVISGGRARAPLAPPEPPNTAITPQSVNARLWVDGPLLVADHSGDVSLADSPELSERLKKELQLLTAAPAPEADTRPAAVLFDVLAHAPKIHDLEGLLWSRQRLSLTSLSEALWGAAGEDALRASLTLLQLAAGARPTKESYPLVPHRLHLLVRATDGLCVCSNRECGGPKENRLQRLGLGTVSAGTSETCGFCSAINLRLLRCNNCGEPVLGAFLHQGAYRAASVEIGLLDFFTTSDVKDASATRITIDPATGARTGAGCPGLKVVRVRSCPQCDADAEQFQPFASGSALTLSILAETVLSELPEFPAKHNLYLPARGRRLLAFSDSRQEAARLGPRLTRQHETQLVRAAVVQSLEQELAADEATVEAERREIERLESEAMAAATPAARQRAERLLREAQKRLESYTVGGKMSDWARAIGEAAILAEIIDIDSAQRHVVREQKTSGDVREWSQRDWERNAEHVKANAMNLLAREFITPNWRAISTETLGLAEVTYPGLQRLEPPIAFLGTLPSDDARSAVFGWWHDLLCALCDSLRVAGVVTFGTDDADRRFQTGGAPVGQWAAKDHTGSRLIRFVGQRPNQLRRRFAAAVLKSSAFSPSEVEELSRELLGAAFEQLHGAATAKGFSPSDEKLPWLEADQRQTFDGLPVPGIRLKFPELGLRRPSALYLCARTGHVWSRTVAGCAPEIGCEMTLRKLTGDELEADPRRRRLRNEYRGSTVFSIGLWAEEHSAQLSPRQNRRLQDLFKAGIRNILSATTTLELGIDIGGLTAALMGNVPPGKANYLQRAGRAGRRSDGSAAVITFARSNPFDREVFRRFGEYLAQPLRRPLVFLDRERVARRHLHAFLLGEFFRALYSPTDRKGAMNAFGNMGRFCGKPAIPYWQPGGGAPAASTPPSSLEHRFRRRLFELKDYGDEQIQAAVAEIFKDTGLVKYVADWPQLIQQVVDSFSAAIEDWSRDYNLMLASWLDAVAEENRPQANAVRYQLKLMAELTVIEALADRQFLPRYGFPIGLQKLRVIEPDANNRDRIREEDQFRLERSGVLAIGEYVPGSQLLAGGKLITSRGLLKHWTGASIDSSPGLRGRFCTCENDHAYYWIAGNTDSCPICNSMPKHSPRDLLFVKHGFSSAAWDPPKWSTEVERIGAAETLSLAFRPQHTSDGHIVRADFAGVRGLTADYRDDGQLMVYNRGEHGHGFAICLRCGYADSEVRTGSGKMNLPRHFEHHTSIMSTKGICWPNDGGGAAVLRNQILAATETTDVLLLNFADCLGAQAADEDLMLTIAHACRTAAARLLELDRRELGVLLVPTGDAGKSRGPVIYDNVSGGAGHVRELLELGKGWLVAARHALFVSDDHHERCESGCLDCLLSFDAQRAMAKRPFARRTAYNALDGLLG